MILGVDIFLGMCIIIIERCSVVHLISAHRYKGQTVLLALTAIKGRLYY